MSVGRPKGSKNRVVDGPAQTRPHPDPDALTDILKSDAFRNPPPIVQKPDSVTMTLTDEDLAPARASKQKHARLADEYIQNQIRDEIMLKKIGEVQELSVPQVVPFDLSGAYVKAAQKKARDAGYQYAHSLRKVEGQWVFEASNTPKVKYDAPSDQS